LNEVLNNSDAKVILHPKAVDRLKEGINSFEGGCAGRLALTFYGIMKLFGKGEHRFPPVDRPERYIVLDDKSLPAVEMQLSGTIVNLPGQGVSVHRKDCINIMNNIDGDNRLIEVAWYTANNVAYKADITIMAHDRTALLMEITNVIGEAKIPLKAINARTTKDQIAIMNLILEITNTEQLESIIKKIRKVDGVFEVSRNRQ